MLRLRDRLHVTLGDDEDVLSQVECLSNSSCLDSGDLCLKSVSALSSASQATWRERPGLVPEK